jgi:hypothetical protein
VVATVAPSGPLRRPGEVAAKVVAEMAATLDAATAALAANDEDAADAVLDRARAGGRRIWLISIKLPPRESPLFVTPRSDAATCT